MKKKILEELKSFIYGSIVLSSLVFLLGLSLIIFRDSIIAYINVIFIVCIIQTVLVNVFLFVRFKKYTFLPFLVLSVISLIVFIILNIVIPDKIIDIIAIMMGVSASVSVVEGLIELFSADVIKNRIMRVIEIAEISIHLFFAVELFVTLGESVKTHLLIYGIALVFHGIMGVLEVIGLKKRKK